ncbi:MAG: small subunit ribosomal protein S8e [Thermoplasmata archaeon]|jgi:small subunit ribosomal protein S8e|nr:small subunit ribosomal protein S8e [Thermoplasmata archaeon]
MAIWQGESKRKPSGGRRMMAHKKRKFEIGREPVLTVLGATKRKYVRIRAAEVRVRMLKADTANVTNPKTGKTAPAKIQTVTGNPANINYVRRNIMTKGAIIQTSAGKARITSRPGQHGAINAVLVE